MHVHAILKQQCQSDHAWEPLLRAAAETMAHVLRIGNVQDRAVMAMFDFPDIVVGFGLASAGILAASLRDIVLHQNQRLPTGLSRAGLIKDLLRFVSHLERLSNDSYHSSTTAFSDAAKTLARIVDDVLDPQRLPPLEAAEDEATNSHLSPFDSGVGNGELWNGQHLSDISRDVLPDLRLVDSIDDLDLNTWLNSLDWNGAAENWMDF